MAATATFNEKVVSVTFSDRFKSHYNHIWLRDNCHCKQCYHDVTKQRLLDTFKIPTDIQPSSVEVDHVSSFLKVVWNNDEHLSTFSLSWLKANAYNPLPPGNEDEDDDVDYGSYSPWNKKGLRYFTPEVEYDDVISTTDGVKDWVNKTSAYGFCFVQNVPVDPIKTKELIERITFIKPTHYGGFWDFTADMSKNDTAYSNIEIPLHTDGTYWSEAPGYQSFHLLKHNGTGGTTSLSDGFNVAYTLKLLNPKYFELLSTVPVDFHCAGEEDVFIQPVVSRPIIIVDEQNKDKVVQIRWNNSDRSVLKIPKSFYQMNSTAMNVDFVETFYKAISAFRELLHDDEQEMFYQLRPGQLLLFDNWRVLHSRTSFTGERRMCGAYYSKDDFISRYKTLNNKREDLVAEL
ncbi:hypothetical protein DASC09_001770 [Saccharomycopsis crataegensis]|uniref:Trimethyllysine dioxygenase n=1 Tax=Saccharomycopsis crataegensis TaxID=43959 RepID=A0AAV5QDY9_9ASCO|nr:hypothetical protein DASC09_001770 [Saccharomycopsis crataegensis]